MRRRRHLTPLELDWARQAVHQLCLANHLKPGDETYLSAGLQAFWEVYTARPSVVRPGFLALRFPQDGGSDPGRKARKRPLDLRPLAGCAGRP